MSDPRYPHDEIGQPGDATGGPETDAGGPLFFDGDSAAANNITSTVNGWTIGTTVATTDVWQEIWESEIETATVPDDITGSSGTRPTSTYVLVAHQGQVWEGVTG